jgi:hypothetical protein
VHSKGIETVLRKVAVRVRKEALTVKTFTTWVKAKEMRTWSRNSTKKKVCINLHNNTLKLFK